MIANEAAKAAAASGTHHLHDDTYIACTPVSSQYFPCLSTCDKNILSPGGVAGDVVIPSGLLENNLLNWCLVQSVRQ